MAVIRWQPVDAGQLTRKLHNLALALKALARERARQEAERLKKMIEAVRYFGGDG